MFFLKNENKKFFSGLEEFFAYERIKFFPGKFFQPWFVSAPGEFYETEIQ
jgi:hypothetical protein